MTICLALFKVGVLELAMWWSPILFLFTSLFDLNDSAPAELGLLLNVPNGIALSRSYSVAYYELRNHYTPTVKSLFAIYIQVLNYTVTCESGSSSGTVQIPQNPIPYNVSQPFNVWIPSGASAESCNLSANVVSTPNLTNTTEFISTPLQIGIFSGSAIGRSRF